MKNVFLLLFVTVAAFPGVARAQTPPTIVLQSSSETVIAGQGASFSVGACGTAPFTYQWQTSTNGSSWSDLSDGAGVYGTATATLGIPAATDGMSGEQFQAVVTNSAGSVTSTPMMLTVSPLPAGAVVAYDITTVAGFPPGYANGQGCAARFNGASGMAVDAIGNVYVADSGNDTIRKIDPSGYVTTIAGSPGVAGNADGQGDVAWFNSPSDIAVDAGGNLYVADCDNFTIRQIDASGQVTTIAGLPGVSGSTDGAGSRALFLFPKDVAVDAAGNIYVSDSGNCTLRKITPAGVVSTLAGTAGVYGSADGTGPEAQFNDPTGLAVDSMNNVYVADSGNNTIRKITPAGVVTTLAGTAGVSGDADGTGTAAQFASPEGLTIDSLGNLYVMDMWDGNIREVTPSGVVTTVAYSPGHIGIAQSGLAMAATGTLYADYNEEVYKIAFSGGLGTVTNFAGDTGPDNSFLNGTGSSATFSPNIEGLATDIAGNVYVGDFYNSAIRKITPSGVVTTLAGGTYGSLDGTGSAAQFANPCAVGVDLTGNVYVADNGNNTIRKITPGGVVTTLAGTAGLTGAADGTGTAAQFNFSFDPPGAGIAVDSAGNVFVADTNNETIRKITPTGVVTTLAGTVGQAGDTNGTGTAALFDVPEGIAIDGAGNLYVADEQNEMIRKVTPEGVVSTLAGNGGASYGFANGSGSVVQFRVVNDVALDAAGDVYVADSANAMVRELTPAGVVSSVCGDANQYGADYGYADGIGMNARFSYVTSVAMDGSDNLYIADNSYALLRKGIPRAIVFAAIGSQPTDASINVGQNSSFSVEANGTAPVSYQWQMQVPGSPYWTNVSDGGEYSGSATPVLSVTGATADLNGAQFQCVAGNAANSVTSSPATLTVDFVEISRQPSSQSAVSGAAAAISVAASGIPGDVLQYQWYLDGVPLTDGSTIFGSQTATLTLSDVGVAAAGSYTVVVTETDPIDGSSTTTSVPATLTVEAPQITSLNPASGSAGGGNLTLTVNGSKFDCGDTVQWVDGTTLATTYVNQNLLTAVVPAADLATSDDITTELINVQSASGDVSNDEAFPIVSSAVVQVQASVAPPGGSATDSTAPITAGAGGVTATLRNTSTSAPPAAVSVANDSGNPTSVAPTIDVGGQYVDLQVTSVTPADTLTAYFYYPSTITGANANNLQLLYFDGTTWDPVLSSGGTVPVKNETPNLNGTVSGGQFTVVFDDTSTPTLTNLSGTVFTPSLVTIPPAILSVTPSPAYLTPANNKMVPVSVAVAATDRFYPDPSSRITSVTSNEPPTDGIAEWQITGPLTLNLLASRLNGGSGRIYTITILTTDSAGNQATAQTEVIVPLDAGMLVDPPVIVTQPQSQTVNAGANVTFSVTTAAALPVTYQWFFNGVVVPGATGTTLRLPSVTLADAGDYAVKATNSIGTTTSRTAKLTVNAPPVFTTQPQSVTADVGAEVVFTAVATGGPKPFYQWFHDGVTVSGGKSGTLTIKKVRVCDAGTYTVKATNSFGSATSNPALLTVNAPPTIKAQPASESVRAGTTVAFTVVATGTPTLTYQWKLDGTAIQGATATTLTLTKVGRSAAGSYSVTVTNSIGSVTSNPAILKVH